MVADSPTGTPISTGFSRFSAEDWSSAARTSPHRDAALTVLSPSRTDRTPIAFPEAATRGTAIDFINESDFVKLHTAISQAAAGGASGITLAFAGSQHPLGGAIPRDALPAIIRALSETPLREIRLSAGRASSAIHEAALPAINRAMTLTMDCDPFAENAAGREAILFDLATAIDEFDRQDRAGAVACADGRLWHAGGASDAQELAATLATLVEYLRAAPRPDRFSIALAADCDQFRTIAKMRAIRLLMARVLDVADIAGPIPRLHAESAWRSMGRREPEANILRGASAAFGAMLGGADTITVLPFDELDAPSPAGARLARNTIAVLASEAGINAVNDPASGSGAIEALTDTVAEDAWAIFQRIERAGGMGAAIAEGTFLRAVASARDERIASVRAASLKMIGVNAFSATPRQPGPDTIEMGERLTFRRPAELFEDVS